jgi:hypothetical protein
MNIAVKFSEQNTTLPVIFKGLQIVEVQKDAEYYAGEYEVTPKVDAQTLPTKNKLMSADLTVKGVPIYETSNNAGGKTVYIAKELE